jgi:nitrogen fixation/metabolism regulation signal transduction histidine kinase
MGLNFFFVNKFRQYEQVSRYVHDYADLNQYGVSLQLKYEASANNHKARAKIMDLILDLSVDVQERIKEREEGFQNVYDNSIIEKFNSYLAPLIVTSKFKGNTQEARELEFENSYIKILRFSKYHNNQIQKYFGTSSVISAIMLFFVIVFSLYYLFFKIKKIISPLKELTQISEKISISDDLVDLNLNQEFYEYQILAMSFRDMYQRINYENRVSDNTSANNSISHLVENIAHAINNPLATIATSLMLVRKKVAKTENEFVSSEVDVCLNQIDRVTEITHKMKSLISASSKLDPTFFEFKNIGTVINLLYFNRFLERNVQFMFNEDIEIYGKEEVIMNIVISLVENSFVHNTAENPAIEVLVNEKDDRWLITVYDNGELIPILDVYRYFLGENPSEGMGLFSARKLAEENGYNLFYNEAPRKEFVLEIKK